ncbi:MAG: fumarylacetoacetase [Flavobacteriales bacterium]|nr:fumarylacetoacetase [Flavobacteriales bacterium]
MKNWINISSESDFSIHNLPYGVFSYSSGNKRIGIAIGDFIIDLKKAEKKGIFGAIDLKDTLSQIVLNPFIGLGKKVTNRVREIIQSELCTHGILYDNKDELLVDRQSSRMHLPVKIGDYTDFYSSKEHATNVGKLFRDNNNPLLPNWKHMPIAYHGRASSIVVSGTNIKRPIGQILPIGSDSPILATTNALDFELELAFIIGKETEQGEQIYIDSTEEYIFGMVLFNDWSARDIQSWEYKPLGPFLGKNFASSISPWVVTLEALNPFSTKSISDEKELLPYLECDGDYHLDINLKVYMQPDNQKESLITTTNYKTLYWNYAQQLAHHTINGCNINVGDIMASGTISGSRKDSLGSLLEITEGGAKSISLSCGLERKYIEDGDSIIMRGYSFKDDIRVGFGEVRSKIISNS